VERVPVVVRDLSDGDTLALALVENLLREDIGPMETARALRRLMDEFGWTQAEMSQRVGKSRSAVTNTLRLLQLPEAIQESVDKGQISEGHARALLSGDSPERQRQVWRQVVEKNLSVRDCERLMRQPAPAAARAAPALSTDMGSIQDRLRRALGTKVQIQGARGPGPYRYRLFLRRPARRAADALRNAARGGDAPDAFADAGPRQSRPAVRGARRVAPFRPSERSPRFHVKHPAAPATRLWPAPLEAVDVSVSYRGRAALQDVSCVVRPGEVAVLVGPNGSGKSTLLRVLARALRPERGAVRLGQRNVAALSSAEYARRVAYVSQEHVVGFGFSVAEHVRLGRAASAEGRRSPPLPEILEALDLEALRSRSLLSLSGGERQRAFVARALAQDADHLLLDEPTAHLDLRHQVALLEVVREAAHERGKGALLVLHDLDLAARYADNLLLLHQGASPRRARRNPFSRRNGSRRFIKRMFTFSRTRPRGARR
jgi:iron complex transport system ATP-binding protein